MSLPVILTMDEAAERLRISRRALQEILKDHPFYFQNGRRKLFTEGDIASIIEALRVNPSRLNTPIQSTGKRRRGRFAASTSGPMWEEVQRRVRELRQQNSPDGSPAASRHKRGPRPQGDG